MTQYCSFIIVCSSVTCVRTHTTLFVKNIHMLDINMNRLLSFKNHLVIVNTHLLLGLKMPYLPNYIFCYECTFRNHDKLFLYIINTQNKWKTTSLYYILYIQGKTTQRKPTQRERVFDTKPPGAKT